MDDRTNPLGEELPPMLRFERGQSASVAGIESRLAQLIDTAALGIISCDGLGRIELFNRAAESIFEVGALEVLGRDWQQFIISHCNDESRDAIDVAIASAREPTGDTWQSISVIRADGWLLPCEIHCVEVAQSDARHLNCFIRNIEAQTRRFREKQAQLSALAEKGRVSVMAEMASSIAHDLNQPLTAITAYLQSCVRLLKSKPEAIELVLSAMEKAAEQTLKAGDIIKRMRALMGPRDTETRCFDVNALIRSAVGFVADDMRADHIEVRLQLQEGLPQVFCDAIDIEQVLLNLLRNGRQAIRRSGAESGSITISTAVRDSAYVQITVQDSGCGISQADRGTLIRQGLSPQDPAQGVGLPVTFSIIEAHGGRLWIDPDIQDGAAFHFTLRTARPNAGEAGT
jgi:two-component system sensor kinase FixL